MQINEIAMIQKKREIFFLYTFIYTKKMASTIVYQGRNWIYIPGIG